MATDKASRDDGAQLAADEKGELSSFEGRCLLKRICECHEVLCQAILGAGEADDKAGDLGPVCEALREAEGMVERAGALVLKKLH